MPGEDGALLDVAEEGTALVIRGLLALGSVPSDTSLASGERTLSSSSIPPSLTGALDSLPRDVIRFAVGLLLTLWADTTEVLLPTELSREPPGASEGLAARDAGTAGGPIEVRLAARLGRAPTVDEVLVFDGVPVLDVEAVELPDNNCFVGDFVGDYNSRSAASYICGL